MRTTVREVPVDPDLARRIQGAADKVASWQSTRDRLIVEAVEAGGSYREVAELAGVSHQTVANIARAARER